MEKKTNKKQVKKTNKVNVEANFLLVIGITTAVAFALNLLVIILHNLPNCERIAEIVDYASFPAGVAALVFIILNFTKWNVVRDQTKVNYRLVLVPYIVTLAIIVALIVALAIYMRASQSLEYAHTIIHGISLPIDLFVCIYSFVLEEKVRKYA